MVLDGKYQEAIEFAFKEMNKGPVKVNTWPHPKMPAFMMHLDSPKAPSVTSYLRTVNFESGEVSVYWSDEHGEWLRQAFVSRPDNVVVQLLTAPSGKSLNTRILVEKAGGSRMGNGMRRAPSDSGSSEIQQDFNEERLIYKCRLDPSTDNSGYAGVIRVVRNGGSARMDGDTLVVENASSLMLLTRIEWFADYSEDKVETLRQEVESLASDYSVLLERHRRVQSEQFQRVTVDFGGAYQHGMATEELFDDQRSRPDFSPALLEKIFQMGALLVHLHQREILQHGGGDKREHQSADFARSPGRPAGRDECLLRLDRESHPRFQGEREKHLRDARHALLSLAG
jgi:alpha-L-fucosidase 2